MKAFIFKLIFLIFFTTNCFCQKDPIEILFETNGDTLIVKSINHTQKNLKVEYVFFGKNIANFKNKLSTELSADESKTVIISKFLPSNKKFPVKIENVKYEYTEIIQNKVEQPKKISQKKAEQPKQPEIITDETNVQPNNENKKLEKVEIETPKLILKNEVSEEVSKYLDSPIPIIFVKDGCSRCELAQNLIRKNKIKAKIINTSTSNENKSLMWSIINSFENETTKITMPVIVNKKDLSYAHKNLSGFILNLK